MNVILARPSVAGLLERYVRLRPSLKQLLRLRSLIVPPVT